MFSLPGKKVLCGSALLCFFSSLSFAEDKEKTACEMMGKGSLDKKSLNILPVLLQADTCLAEDTNNSKALAGSMREASILSLEVDNIMDPSITVLPADNSMDPQITLWQPKRPWRMEAFRRHRYPFPGDPHRFWLPEK
jgi:hypothetical protein